MAAKKKTRKQLLKEPDEFITFTGKAITFVTGYQKQISYTLCTIAAVALIFFGYRFFAQRAETKAFTLLGQTQSRYDELIQSSSETEAYNQVSQAFQNIIKKYGGNAGGKLARLIYANISYDAQQYDTAIGLYKQSLSDFKDDEFVYNMILSNLGHAYQRGENEQDAAAYFEKAASATDSPVREEALFNLGLMYKKSGETTKSQKMLQEILDSYPDSIYFDLAEEELSTIKK
jgi:tetratricopeptide (TPR) repeat protein